MTDPAALVPFLDRQVRALPWTRPPEPTGILSPLHEARDRFPFVALTTVRFAPLLRKHYGAGWRHIDGDEGRRQICLRLKLRSYGGFLAEVRAIRADIDPTLCLVRRDLIELATDLEAFRRRYRRQIAALID